MPMKGKTPNKNCFVHWAEHRNLSLMPFSRSFAVLLYLGSGWLWAMTSSKCGWVYTGRSMLMDWRVWLVSVLVCRGLFWLSPKTPLSTRLLPSRALWSAGRAVGSTWCRFGSECGADGSIVVLSSNSAVWVEKCWSSAHKISFCSGKTSIHWFRKSSIWLVSNQSDP